MQTHTRRRQRCSVLPALLLSDPDDSSDAAGSDSRMTEGVVVGHDEDGDERDESLARPLALDALDACVEHEHRARRGGSVVGGADPISSGFPSTCPYVTAIGTTQVNPRKKVADPEDPLVPEGSGCELPEEPQVHLLDGRTCAYDRRVMCSEDLRRSGEREPAFDHQHT